MVEEIAVVGDGDHRTGILLQMLLEPVDRFSVEVVGRLVEQKHVGLLKQQAAQSHPAALTAGERGDILVVGRTLERIHGALELRIDIPGIGCVEGILKLGLTLDEFIHLVGVFKHIGVAECGVDLVELFEEIHHGLDAFTHHFDYRLLRVELRLLLQIAYGIAGSEHYLALNIAVETGDNLQKRRFTGAVQTDNADLGAIEKRQIYVFKYLFLGRIRF